VPYNRVPAVAKGGLMMGTKRWGLSPAGARKLSILYHIYLNSRVSLAEVKYKEIIISPNRDFAKLHLEERLHTRWESVA
jgi:hypothetical protein